MDAPTGFGTWPFGEELLFEAVATATCRCSTCSTAIPAGDAVADPGAVRPARASGGDRALPEVPDRAAAADPSARRGRAARQRGAGACRRTRAFGRRVRERRRAAAGCTAGRRAARARSGATRAGPRRRRTRSCRCWRPTRDRAAAADRDRVTPTAVRRLGRGLWLPECAYAPWLDPALERAGIRAACVELTNALGLGSERHLTPIRSAEGPGAVADRPGDDRAGVGAGRLSVAAAISRLPRATRPIATASGGSTAGQYHRRHGGSARREPTRPEFDG